MGLAWGNDALKVDCPIHYPIELQFNYREKRKKSSTTVKMGLRT
jgi:hypothetical protein